MSTAVDQQQLSDWTDAFARDGHICLPQFLAGDALEELQDNLDRYIRDVVPGLPATHAFYENREDPATLKQMQYMQDEDSFFAELIRRDCFVEVAKSFLGENVITQGAEYFNKPAGLGKATPPHQDGYYFCLVPNKAVTFWIALDVVDEENGCLGYVTGSHNSGVRPHGASQILGFSQGVQDWGPADEARETKCILQPGDVLVHHSLTIHRADANTSDRSRRAMGLVYFAESAQVDPTLQQNYKDSLTSQHADMGIATT